MSKKITTLLRTEATKSKVLFYNDSPSMGNSPLLTEPITNFDVLDIYLVDNDGSCGFVSVLTSMGQFIATITKGSAGNTEVYIKSALYLIDIGANTLTFTTARRIQGYFSSNAQSVTNTACIAIKAVVGRKLGGVVSRLLNLLAPERGWAL